MKLVTFKHNDISRVGSVVDNTVVDGLEQQNIPQTMLEFLAAGQAALDALQQLIDSQQARIPLNEGNHSAYFFVPIMDPFLVSSSRPD